MRYAIVSDLHANFAAWQTVLTDIGDLKADKIICLGDVVGYGPKPVEVLESVYRHVNVTLMGNHDAAVCGRCDPADFSERAQVAVADHKSRLSASALVWLRRLPYLHEEPGFCCTHGDFDHPEQFNYITDPESALPSWRVRKDALMFVGHSHLPGIYVLGASGQPHYLPPTDFVLEPGKRFIVNPGSVGYPRAGECRSTYCIYDSSSQSVVFRQLPFDSAGYRAEMERLGWGDSDGWVLEKERRQHSALREKPAFGKPAAAKPVPETPKPSVTSPKPAVEETIKKLRLPAKKVALIAGIAAGAVAAVALIVAFCAGRNNVEPSYAVRVPDYELTTSIAYPLTPTDKNLLPPWPAADANGRLPGWRYALEDKNAQRFSTGLRDGEITLRIISSAPGKARVESAIIDLRGTDTKAVRIKVKALKGAESSGVLMAGTEAYSNQDDGEYRCLRTDQFELRPKGKSADTVEVNRKITLPKKCDYVRFFVECSGSDIVELLPPYLGKAE